VKGSHVVTSCRVTQRDEPVRRENWMPGVSVTIKVRDAFSRLESKG
jgi:hypothetical protein